MKEPKDLGIKIGTKEEKFWTDMKDKSLEIIGQSKHEITIQEHIVKLCDEKIKSEQR
jgi:hypothetical protein|tara:strand:+ start:615 stop:785 length:171 start_codon:yes stop_codon:yes gene_type:complete